MKISERKLRKIIREEVSKALINETRARYVRDTIPLETRYGIVDRPTIEIGGKVYEATTENIMNKVKSYLLQRESNIVNSATNDESVLILETERGRFEIPIYDYRLDLVIPMAYDESGRNVIDRPIQVGGDSHRIAIAIVSDIIFHDDKDAYIDYAFS